MDGWMERGKGTTSMHEVTQTLASILCCAIGVIIANRDNSRKGW